MRQDRPGRAGRGPAAGARGHQLIIMTRMDRTNAPSAARANQLRSVLAGRAAAAGQLGREPILSAAGEHPLGAAPTPLINMAG